MKTKFANYIFGASFLLIWGSVSVLSQNKCNLQIDVYEFKEDGSSENFPVRDARLTLVSKKTGQYVKTGKNAEAPTFADVDDGEYEISVSKEGFKKTVDSFSFECGLADAQNTHSFIEFLWKGNSQEIFNVTAKQAELGTQFNKQESTPINNGAVLLGKPVYPAAAKAVRATGKVEVQVTINELGYVISAQAISGHPLLRSAAVKAARESKVRMTFLEGIPVKVTGIIDYNFVP